MRLRSVKGLKLNLLEGSATSQSSFENYRLLMSRILFCFRNSDHVVFLTRFESKPASSDYNTAVVPGLITMDMGARII